MARLGPTSLPIEEQRALLEVSAQHPRDHLVISLALGTGLRLREIVGLDVGDLFFPTAEPRQRFLVRAEIAKRGRVGDIFLPDVLVSKVREFWQHKATRGESLAPEAPLLCSVPYRRISPRHVQRIVRQWQVAAGFGRLYPFHSLRHTAVTNIYRASRNLFLAQRFARHASPMTTVLYTHPSDEELREGVRDLFC